MAKSQHMQHLVKPMDGFKVGRLTVIRRDGTLNEGAAWLCLCECGNTIRLKGITLRRGGTRSCGCLQRDTLSAMRFKHGASRRAKGDVLLHKAYITHSRMINRCEDPSHPDFKNYGGRGISVCGAWKDFKRFLADMGKPPGLDYSIGRKDNSKGYGPSNCRWETVLEQARNKRTTRLVKIGNEVRTITEWERLSGVTYITLNRRIKRGTPSSVILVKGFLTKQEDPTQKNGKKHVKRNSPTK